MGDIIYRLLLFLNSRKNEDLDYTIATTMLHNIKDIPNMSINKLADICYTSPAAITRFCRKLGYSNLSEFKQSTQFNINSYDLGLMRPKAINFSLAREDLLKNMYTEVYKEINSLIENIDFKIVDMVINLIFSSPNVSIFGTQYSQLMAQDLQRRLVNVGKIINHANDVQEQEKLAEDLTEGSLAILISPTGRFPIYHERLWKKIKESSAIVVIITGAKNDEYLKRGNYILSLPSSENSNLYIQPYRYSLCYLIEYLYIRYGSLYAN